MLPLGVKGFWVGNLLTRRGSSANILTCTSRGRGVAVNTSACQAEDRGFDPRRSRSL